MSLFGFQSKKLKNQSFTNYQRIGSNLQSQIATPQSSLMQLKNIKYNRQLKVIGMSDKKYFASTATAMQERERSISTASHMQNQYDGPHLLLISLYSITFIFDSFHQLSLYSIDLQKLMKELQRKLIHVTRIPITVKPVQTNSILAALIFPPTVNAQLNLSSSQVSVQHKVDMIPYRSSIQNRQEEEIDEDTRKKKQIESLLLTVKNSRFKGKVFKAEIPLSNSKNNQNLLASQACLLTVDHNQGKLHLLSGAFDAVMYNENQPEDVSFRQMVDLQNAKIDGRRKQDVDEEEFKKKKKKPASEEDENHQSPQDQDY